MENFNKLRIWRLNILSSSPPAHLMISVLSRCILPFLNEYVGKNFSPSRFSTDSRAKNSFTTRILGMITLSSPLLSLSESSLSFIIGRQMVLSSDFYSCATNEIVLLPDLYFVGHPALRFCSWCRSILYRFAAGKRAVNHCFYGRFLTLWFCRQRLYRFGVSTNTIYQF